MMDRLIAAGQDFVVIAAEVGMQRDGELDASQTDALDGFAASMARSRRGHGSLPACRFLR